ncbi:hypothetical protein L0128_17545 [candidate division KSB1 bacterium]|nr:hypothetical protein [candidate division KSB1 bacterium]
MAHFEGIQWASKQMRYLLNTKQQELLESNAKVYAVSRSIHYGLFLAFEGIRFFCEKNEKGKLVIVFFNWHKNMERFQRGIAFNLGSEQQALVPTKLELVDMFISYFRAPEMQPFLNEMAEKRAQGYLRPFTVDEDQSIGVTFPANPAIRAVVCRYDQYLGEPFMGVVVPYMVRVIGINQTGCLKLGVNYLMSVKAVDAAKKILPGAASALFLDDKVHLPLNDRMITEWDSSCCLIALQDGSVVKIPESNLILPSVTIQGVVALLRQKGVTVVERDFSFGELAERTRANQIVAICSIGTAGILNRCDQLLLIDEKNKDLMAQKADKSAEIYKILGEMKSIYWQIYQGKYPVPSGMQLDKYEL